MPSAPRRSWKAALRLVVHHGAVRLLAGVLRLRPRREPGERPRVVFLLAHAYGIGGTTRTCLNLAGGLAAGHDVEILSVLRTRKETLLPHPPGVLVSAIDDSVTLAAESRLSHALRRLPSVLFLPTDQNMLRRVSLWADVLLVRALWRAGDGAFIGTRPALNNLLAGLRRPGSVVIAQEHMNIAAHRPRARREIVRIYQRVDAAVVLTDGDREAFRVAVGPEANVLSIPNGVPMTGRKQAPLDRPVVVAVGRLTRQKGLDRLITAFAQVVAAHPDWELRICGAGPRRAALQKQIGELGLDRHVTLLGQVNHVERELLGASVFALSSHFEGLPMALIEAMSVGLPVVAFDCPTGPGEVIEHGRSGLLVPEGDIDALARALTEVIGDEPRRRALSQGALVRSRHYASEAITPRWEELIRDLLTAHERPAPRHG